MSSLQSHRATLASIAGPVSALLPLVVSRAHSTLSVWSRRVRTRRHLREVPADRFADLGLTPRAVAIELAKGFWQA